MTQQPRGRRCAAAGLWWWCTYRARVEPSAIAGRSREEQEDEHVHLKEMEAVPVRCATRMATKTRAPRLQTSGPREGQRTATAAALRTHARTPYRLSYGGCTIRTSECAMLSLPVDKQASWPRWSTFTSPALRAAVPSCHGSLVRRARYGIRWSELTQRRAALRAGGHNYGPSLS